MTHLVFGYHSWLFALASAFYVATSLPLSFIIFYWAFRELLCRFSFSGFIFSRIFFLNIFFGFDHHLDHHFCHKSNGKQVQPRTCSRKLNTDWMCVQQYGSTITWLKSRECESTVCVFVQQMKGWYDIWLLTNSVDSCE